MDHQKAFFIIPPVCSIPEATRNAFFDWYTSGIRLSGIHITTFFAVIGDSFDFVVSESCDIGVSYAHNT